MGTVFEDFINFLNRFVNYMDTFEIVQGKTSFTGPIFQTMSIAVFLSSLYFLSKFMENRPALQLKKFSTFHNFLCSFIALTTLLGMLYGLTRVEMHRSPKYPDHNYYYNLYAPRGTRLKGALYFWCLIYHAQKWYDLIDTYLIVLMKSKKGLSFLHVYHHAVMLMLTNECFAMDFCAIWLPCFCNCVVHVVMYFYYALNCLGVRWKNRHYITILQLIQFGVIASYFIFFFLPGRFIFKINCSGNLWMCVVSFFVDLFFAYLFLDFYLKTFKKKKSDREQLGQSTSVMDRFNSIPNTTPSPTDFFHKLQPSSADGDGDEFGNGKAKLVDLRGSDASTPLSLGDDDEKTHNT